MGAEAAKAEREPVDAGATATAETGEPGRRYAASPYSYAEAQAIAAALDVAEPVAIALVRRGYRTPDEARAFLDAGERHDPRRFEGIDAAVELAAIAIESGSRITVHGDYDVDGICATAILVGALRELGADCDWLIPDRSADGYGIGAGTLQTLQARGTELLITVDCGIASADEVDELLAAGIEVIVTDHHAPGDRLPRCPIVHPRVSEYPFGELCGAAVAAKLAALLRGDDDIDRDVDLVSLATIADMVPLLGENRAIVKRGLAELRRGRRAGPRALMRVANVEPEALDESDIGFRLAPRLNAAGRLYRADAGVELMLCVDEARAAEIAAELDAANHERREIERQVYAEAEAVLRDLPPRDRDAAAIVVAGDGWHPGVVGIVASRLVERHQRPAIVLSLDDEGGARGSGRAPSGYDLLAGLKDAAAYLRRFGGHRAAAGVELDASEIDRFRRALAAHADAAAPGEGYSEPLGVDAFVGAEALSLDLAEQIAELGPFGLGNPSVELLVPGAKVENVQPMGEGGRHARFSIRSGRGGARGVAFGANGRLAAAQRSPHDLAVRLEINRWNGVAEPRAVLSDAYERAPHGTGGGGGGSGSSSVSHLCPGVEADAWWGRFQEELERGARAIAPAPLSASQLISAWRQRGRTTFDRRGRSALAQVSELASTRERVLVLTSDAARRAALIGVGHGGRCVCLRCSATALEAAVEDGSCRLLVSDWTSVSRSPELTAEFEHLVVLDPPVLEAPAEVVYGARGSGGFLHALLAPPEELALRCWEAEWGLRPALAEIYRSVGGSGCAELAGEGLRAALSGSGPFPRTPEISARCVRILVELGIAELLDGGDARLLRVVSSEKTDLERSGAWRAVQATHEAGLRFLEGLTTEHSRSPSALAS